MELGKICTFEYGKPLKEIDRKGGEYPVYGSNGIVGYHNEYLVKGPFIIVGRKGTAGAVVYSEKSGFPIDTTFYIQLKENDLLFSIAGAFGRVAVIPKSVLPANTNQALAIITLKKGIYPKFIFNFLKSSLVLEEIGKLKVGVAQYNISLQQVSKLKIPLPPPEIQKHLVAEMEEQEKIIEANEKLIGIMEQKITEVLNEI